ncbi:DUF2523 domain-containing protein [Stenotrophomonas sp. GD03819]|uniref:DUF2523 family protein n=1 Tax=Stenotrophomonas TaxID=40323 RepID=UPI0015F4E3EB|nr:MULTISPECIES: DUF2523 family protein [Stenotrophomonas]MDH1790568.1 DUF2523 domain-containing protein [Stenotrophomonas sp. GD03819]
MFEKLTTTLVGFAAHLLGALKVAASFIFARVLAAAGLTFVNYKYVLPDVKQFVAEQAGGMDGSVVQLAGAMGVDVFMTMILSALVARVGMRAFIAGIEQIQGMINDAGG